MRFKKIILEPMKQVEFKVLNGIYGRAEFIVEAYFKKNGRISKIRIYPQHQRQPDRLGVFYEVKSGYSDVLTFDCSINGEPDIDKPKVWMVGWCKEHNVPFYRIYAPDGTKYFRVYVGSSMTFELRGE